MGERWPARSANKTTAQYEGDLTERVEALQWIWKPCSSQTGHSPAMLLRAGLEDPVDGPEVW